LGRAGSKAKLLLSVAMAVAVVGAVPGDGAYGAPPGDPPGNNGTIKTKKTDPAEDPNANNNDNQPHIDGCVVWLSYTGFDQGQTADITITAHKPSGDGEVLIADKGVAVSPDAAGGGQDQDVVIAYNLADAVKDLKRQKNQGYHLKVASDTNEAPGGAKQKVFWLDCTPAPAATLRIAKAVEGSGQGPFEFSLVCNHRPLDRTFTLDPGGKLDVEGVPPGTTCVVTETNPAGASETESSKSEEPADDAADGKVTTKPGSNTVVTFTNVYPNTEGGTPPPANDDLPAPPPPSSPVTEVEGTSESAGPGGETGTPAPTPDSTVLGETLTAPDSTATLPRTGADPRPLTTAGLWSLAAGGLALLAGRRLRRG
jgi:hypothetical protein